MMVAGFAESCELRFILLNARCFGGAGFRTLEERLAEAIEQLSISSESLALLLIEILSIQDRDEASKK
jgi:hypothetical protein